MKETQDLYIKKIIKYCGEIFKNLNKWKDIPYSEIRCLHTVKNDQQIQHNPKQNHSRFFVVIAKLILKFIWK